MVYGKVSMEDFHFLCNVGSSVTGVNNIAKSDLLFCAE